MAKWDEAADAIRWLSGRNPAGIPLDVADDVARAAYRAAGNEPTLEGLEGGIPSRRGATTSRDALYGADGRSLPEDPDFPGWPSGVGAWGRAPSQFDGVDAGPLDDAPDFELGSPLWHQLHKASRAHDNLRRNRTPNLRNQNPQLARIAGDAIRTRDADAIRVRSADAERARGLREGLTDAATAAGIAGLPFLIDSPETPSMAGRPPADSMDAVTSTAGTADLAEETSPAPKVEAEAGDDYSYQARMLINKLNAMRRAAGGEVPEADEITAEVHRLLDMASTQKNAPSYKPPMPTDYHGEAQRLLQELNARRMEAGGEVADTADVMAKVRKLQAMGDRMRNGG